MPWTKHDDELLAEAVGTWIDQKARERAAAAARKLREYAVANDLSLSALNLFDTPVAVARRFSPEGVLEISADTRELVRMVGLLLQRLRVQGAVASD